MKQINSTADSISTWHLTDDSNRISVASVDKIEFEGNIVWYVSRVNVITGHRGKGIGSRMLTSLIEEIKLRKDAANVIVTPGGYDNDTEKQMNFYKKNGFINGSQPGILIYYIK